MAKQQSNAVCTPWQRTSGGLSLYNTFLIWNVRYMSNETVERTIKKLLCHRSSKWWPQFYSEVCNFCGEKCRNFCTNKTYPTLIPYPSPQKQLNQLMGRCTIHSQASPVFLFFRFRVLQLKNKKQGRPGDKVRVGALTTMQSMLTTWMSIIEK